MHAVPTTRQLSDLSALRRVERCTLPNDAQRLMTPWFQVEAEGATGGGAMADRAQWLGEGMIGGNVDVSL